MTFAGPICGYDTKANTWRSAEGIVKWSHDLGVDVVRKARARFVHPSKLPLVDKYGTESERNPHLINDYQSVVALDSKMLIDDHDTQVIRMEPDIAIFYGNAGPASMLITTCMFRYDHVDQSLAIVGHLDTLPSHRTQGASDYKGNTY